MTGKPVTKGERRGRLIAERGAIDLACRRAIDAAICASVRRLDEWRGCDVVLTYLSVGSEVDTAALVEAALLDGKVVALPYCVPQTRDMRWYRVCQLSGLVRSPQGILEPDPLACDEVELSDGTVALAIVPGLEFDVQGYRLGYGGGYYDRFLSGFEGASIGLCRSQFLCADLGEHVLLDPHDRRVDVVVTEDVAIRAKGAR